MEESILINGKPVPENFPLRSLFFGEGVFETFRWRSSQPAFLDRHIERMRSGAHTLGVPFPGEEEILGIIDKVVSAFEVSDVYVKICLLSRGSSIFYGNPQGTSILTVVRGYQSPSEPVKALASDHRRSSTSIISRLKSLNYLENIHARRNANRLGFDDAILLNERGEITEATSSNIFWLRDGALKTPSLECGVLPGITRGLVVDIAEELGIEINQGYFNLNSILNCQCCFLTNSLIGMVPLSHLGDVELATDKSRFEVIRASLLQRLGWI